MKTFNDIYSANDAEIDSYLGDVSAVDFRRHVDEFSGKQRSLRDWFAGMALQGMLACPLDAPGEDYPDKRDKLCRVAFEYADAMLAARKEAK